MRLTRLFILILSFYALQTFSSSLPVVLNSCLILNSGEQHWHWSSEPGSDCSTTHSDTVEKLFPSPDLTQQLTFVSISNDQPKDKVCISEQETNQLLVCSSDDCHCACFYQDGETHYKAGKVSSIENKDHCLTEAGAQHHYYQAFVETQNTLATRSWENNFNTANSPAQGTSSTKAVVFGSALLALGLNSTFGLIYGWNPLEMALGMSYACLRIGISYVGGKIHPRLGRI
ncbi:hypothetical protein [Endozoicomonas arenosclerae]|uniref:hypothetical protein n=1 Tax=Endozoicomonas arenosclerae TaxID=1633495 RepID=UPI000783A892|nr:hypothetical protein [Endozoicomonas arenosclerae]